MRRRERADVLGRAVCRVRAAVALRPGGRWACALVAAALLASGARGQVLFQEKMDAGLEYYQSGALFGTSAAIGDYDGDGWLDVLLTGGRPAGMKLYRNRGDGTFEDVTAATIPFGLPWISGAMFLDLNNNGRDDIVFTSEANNRSWTGFGVMINDGGYFTLANISPDFARADGRLGGLTAADIDGDGLLDVVKVHYMGTGFLLKNTGAGFADLTSSLCIGLGVHRNSWQPAFGDFNNDGFQDLHIAVDFDSDVQFRNTGAGELVDVTFEANVTNEGSDMGLAIADINNNGSLDIFSSNIRPHVLYVNDGTGRFEDEAEARGVAFSADAIGRGWGSEFADLNHNGYVDLAMVDSSSAGAVWINDGDGYFERIEATPLGALTGYGLIAFDFDRDGDLDLLVTAGIGWPRLLENITPRGPDSNWLTMRLRGTFSNRDGVGARIRVVAGDLRMIREIQCGSSFKTSGPREAHFGLGPASVADRIEVMWPSGVVRVYENVAANQHLELVEPSPDLNGDGIVNLADVFVLLSNFGGPGGPEDGDFNGNGVVDLADLSTMLAAFARWN